MRCHGLPGPSIFRVEGALAQLGERLVCNQEVAGSIPVRSTLRIGHNKGAGKAPLFFHSLE